MKKKNFVGCYLCIFMYNKMFYYDIPVLVHVIELYKANCSHILLSF